MLGARLHERDGATIAELAEPPNRGEEELAIEGLLVGELIARFATAEGERGGKILDREARR